MFRHRTNFQKPTGEFYTAFRQSFPEVRAPLAFTPGYCFANSPSDQPRIRSQRHKNIRDSHLQPGASHDSSKFTPPLPDPNTVPPALFSDQSPTYSTPRAGGTNVLYCNEDFAPVTPGIGMDMGISTPRLLSTPGDEMRLGWIAHRNFYSPRIAQASDLSHSNCFDPPRHLAPCYLSDQPPDFAPLDNSAVTPPTGEGRTETEIHLDPTVTSLPPNAIIPTPLRASGEKFRFQTKLHAATAMIHQVNEIPVTYLNKGNIYWLSIIDTAPTMPGSSPVQYRTSICISFEDTQQGPRPATRWSFWEEGRGTEEFHQRGGKMQGIEFVETKFVTEGGGRTRVNLETASIDRFSVLWTGGSSASVDCHIAMRFNFLSTDFSHSKGVKGIPSRLCAKTEIVSADSLYCSSQVPEICFCEVKVFRDHGAERKLANDIALVKKRIGKLEQQLVQVKTSVKDSRKRKRNGSIARKIMQGSPVTDTTHKRTQSISSAGPTEEDLHIKLQIMQDTLLSSQPVSLLNIRGQEQYHLDMHPIEPTDEPRGQWSKLQTMAPAHDLQQSNSQHLLSPPGQPMDAEVLQRDSSGTPATWIGPFQVDCLYLLHPRPQHPTEKEYYQVVYIMKHNAKDLIARIAAKCNFDPTSILQVVNLNQNRLNGKADKAAINELPEAQNMALDLSGIAALPVRREWDAIADATFNSEDIRVVENAIQSEGYLLKLIL